MAVYGDKTDIATCSLNELGLDNNVSDNPDDVVDMPTYFGTPICYAVETGDEGLVRFMLDRDADSYLKIRRSNTFTCVARSKKESVLEKLNEWQGMRDQEG